MQVIKSYVIYYVFFENDVSLKMIKYVFDILSFAHFGKW